MPAFALQFPVQQVKAYADRYADRYADEDAAVLEIGRNARERGHYTRDEFMRVCRWKTPRTAPLVAANAPGLVEAATRVALSDHSREAERIEALRSLRGVEWATASVLLHAAYPERYPILDKRALQALGVAAPGTYTHQLWASYTAAWLALVKRAGVDGRTFDQALWQWSKEQGAPLY